MAEWMPIDTAPRDFTTVQLKVPGYRRPFTGWFDGKEWIADRGLSLRGPHYYPDPTHWMPL